MSRRDTSRDEEVLSLKRQGSSYKEIAAYFGVSISSAMQLWNRAKADDDARRWGFKSPIRVSVRY